MIIDCYDERQYSCCLDIMTTTVEVYGGADEAMEHFRALLGRASARTFATVQVKGARGAIVSCYQWCFYFIVVLGVASSAWAARACAGFFMFFFPVSSSPPPRSLCFFARASLVRTKFHEFICMVQMTVVKLWTTTGRAARVHAYMAAAKRKNTRRLVAEEPSSACSAVPSQHTTKHVWAHSIQAARLSNPLIHS